MNRKRAIIVVVVLVILIGGGGVFWMKTRAGSAGSASAKPEEKPAEESHVKRDDLGRVVIKMDDETQGNVGLLVEKPAASELSPEVKGYGRVLDPAPLVALVTELASANAAYSASSNELARSKILSSQTNASQRALQTAQAAAQHDELAVRSARERLALSWGKVVTDRADLPALVQSLASQEGALVRIDLPAGETLKGSPSGARLFTLSGKSAEAEFLGTGANVDPQMLGRGFLFLIRTNTLRFLPGEALTGYLKVPGEPLAGVIIPNSAVVRTEGAGWIYVLNEGGDSFTRVPVSLEHPFQGGWFVTNGVSADQYMVTTGAQILLSEELKASLKPD